MSDPEQIVPPDMTDSLRSVLGDPEPGTVFSKPERVGDSLVFTASAWERAGGFGYGSGQGTDGEESGGGGGGGGGGTSQGRPVAVIRASETGIEVKPVIDFTKIGVTCLFALAGWLTMRRRSS
ncbi:MAG: hypothetical protein WBM90_13700 [Acidimicrobiia bacterium]